MCAFSFAQQFPLHFQQQADLIPVQGVIDPISVRRTGSGGNNCDGRSTGSDADCQQGCAIEQLAPVELAGGVIAHDRIVAAVGKHITAQQTAVGRDEDAYIDEVVKGKCIDFTLQLTPHLGKYGVNCRNLVVTENSMRNKNITLFVYILRPQILTVYMKHNRIFNHLLND